MLTPPEPFDSEHTGNGGVRKPAFSAGRIWAWCLYDWAYSAFNTVVSTFIIATWYVRAVAVDPATGTADWAATQAIAGFIIAVVAAPAGIIADRSGRRRLLMGGFTAVMAIATGLLWFVRPTPEDATAALLLVGIATVAYEIATVFYNAMLPEIAPPHRLGRISGLAWGAGYVGGLVCLGTCLVLLINPNPPPFRLDRGQTEQVRACAVFAAIWIAVFSWPVLVAVPDVGARRTLAPILRSGARDLRQSVRRVLAHPGLGRFLLARMIYADGLTTLFAFGGIFAAGVFEMDTQHVLILGIGLNVTAGLGALGFALVEDRLGQKATILTCLMALFALGAAVLLVRDVTSFWVCALGLGLFLGPAQAASRSLMARATPAATRNAGFGLYALSGRVTGFLGPAALSVVTAATGSQRAGMVVILVLLAVGGSLLATTQISIPKESPNV